MDAISSYEKQRQQSLGKIISTLDQCLAELLADWDAADEIGDLNASDDIGYAREKITEAVEALKLRA